MYALQLLAVTQLNATSKIDDGDKDVSNKMPFAAK